MKQRIKRGPTARWCSVHRTKDPPLKARCAYGDHQMHVHTGHVLLAKRGIAQAIVCSRCLKVNRLMVAWNGKRWELVRQDLGNPAYQLTLDAKAH